MWWTTIVLMALWPAQGTPAQSTAPAQGTEERYSEYRVGPGDKLSLTVYSVKELEQSLRVSNSGKIHVPHLGVLQVAGMTVAQIEDEVGLKLRAQQLVNEPWVRVQVTEYNSQPVSIVGEVYSPGQFMISGEMRLLDLISKAGGFTPSADAEGYLIRRKDIWPRAAEAKTVQSAGSSEAGSVQTPAGADAPAGVQAPGGEQAPATVPPAAGAQAEQAAKPAGTVPPVPGIKINIKELKDGSTPHTNLTLQGGDIFFVPRRRQQQIYIVGEVGFPGAYGLPQYFGHLTAARAVSYAGGPLKTAKSSKGFIMRHDSNGGLQTVAFDFLAITKGKLPDLPIMPNDIIYVPRSVGKQIGYKMLDLIPQMVYQFIIF